MVTPATHLEMNDGAHPQDTGVIPKCAHFANSSRAEPNYNGTIMYVELSE